MTVELQQEEGEAEEISDQLLEIELKTVDKKTVRARVNAIKDRGDQLVLQAEVPGGETVRESMPKPVPWCTKYKFARIVEDKGYDAGTSHHLIDDEVLIKRTVDDDWEFEDPKGWSWYVEHHPIPIVGTVAFLGMLVAGAYVFPEVVVLLLFMLLLVFMLLIAP